MLPHATQPVPRHYNTFFDKRGMKEVLLCWFWMFVCVCVFSSAPAEIRAFLCVFICLWAVTFSSPILNSNISPFPPAISRLRRMHIYEAHFNAPFLKRLSLSLSLLSATTNQRQTATRSINGRVLSTYSWSRLSLLKTYKSN